MFIHTQVNDQRNQYLQCWNRVLHNCMESTSGPQLGMPSIGQKVKDKDRQIIKVRATRVGPPWGVGDVSRGFFYTFLTPF